MNVLLTSVGRRSYLVRYFQQALDKQGVVVAANAHAHAPGMQVADHAEVVPSSDSPGYIEKILKICERYDIGMLCSCHDLDTFILSRAQQVLAQAGVTAILPCANWGLTCLDKFECGSQLHAAGFNVPWASISLEETITALNSGEVKFPLIVKTRLGFGSLGLAKCQNIQELAVVVRSTAENATDTAISGMLDISSDSSVLIQEWTPGPEMCLSVVNDLKGQYAGHFICEVHAMRAGESDSATTVQPDILGDLPYRLSQYTRHIGIWGIDVMMNNDDPVIIDVNPRFTGDYPFQHLAGANVPAALCAWAEDRNHNAKWLSPSPGVSGYKDLLPRKLVNKPGS